LVSLIFCWTDPFLLHSYFYYLFKNCLTLNTIVWICLWFELRLHFVRSFCSTLRPSIRLNLTAVLLFDTPSSFFAFSTLQVVFISLCVFFIFCCICNSSKLRWIMLSVVYDSVDFVFKVKLWKRVLYLETVCSLKFLDCKKGSIFSPRRTF